MLIFVVPEIDIPVAQSTAVSSVNDALAAAEKIGYPVILRSAFTLGGLGSGFANDPDELRDLSAKSLSLSPQVLIERSMKGWKELEYEVVRDAADVRIAYHSASPFCLHTMFMFHRIPSFAATWRTSILLVRTLVILSSLPRPRPCPMTSTICSDLRLSRLFGILEWLASVISNTLSTPTPGNTVLSRSMLG